MTDLRGKLSLRRIKADRADMTKADMLTDGHQNSRQKHKRHGNRPRFMYLFAVFSLVASLGVSFVVPANVFAAACAAPTTDLGTVSMSVNVTADATYSVWTRMIAADAANNAVNLEIDGTDCFSVGGGTFAQTAWATTGANWVNYANGTPSTPISKPLTTGPHTFKYIGTKAGVGVDKLLITSDTTCLPVGTDGCPQSSTDTTPPTVNLLTPTASQNVTGPVDLTATAADASGVASVKFLIDGQEVGQDATDPYSFSWNSASVQNGTHTVAAQATDKNGLSATSSPVAIVTNNTSICSGTPSVPAGLAVTGTAATSISLGWSASTPATSCTIKGYNIYRNGTKVTSVNSGTTFDDTGLTPGASFSYTVSAIDTSGHESGQSTAVNATTGTDADAPNAPGNLHTTMITNNSIALAWDASTSTDVTSYVLYRGGNQATTSTTPAATDTGLNPNTTYSYTVKARDAAGNLSQASTAISGTTSAGSSTSGSMYIDPSSGTFAPGASVTVSIREDSKTANVNAAQADLSYSANTLEYQSIDVTTSDFGVDAAKSGGSGKVSIARGNTSPLSGDKLIAKVTFKVLGTGSGTISFDDTSAVLSSDTNENIASQGLGAAFTLATATTPPPTTPPPTTPPPTTPPPTTPPPSTPPPSTPPPATPPPSARPTTPPPAASTTKTTTTTSTSPTASTSKTSTSTNTIAPTGNSQPATLPSGSEVELSDPAVITTTSSSSSSVKRVEYWLNGKKVGESTTPPFNFKVDLTHVRNGKYTLVTKTYYQNGKMDSSTQTITANNPMNFTQLMLQLQHYAWLLLLLALVAGGAIWYFFFRRPAEDDFGGDDFGGGGFDPNGGGGFDGTGTGSDIPPAPGGQITPGGFGAPPPGGDPYAGRY